ncbi:hypothetical protein D9X30_4910 [Cupriavidus sp. U2]|uniref:hypothetical protein n=1 Tax=Cupriavidus sp. U2 TaxID=2920269 RepID=UPI00129D702B|nr:hypothetical protein [Cupriavidus sp. U2]KAI3589327.1 hypothetical protein D9X30_4910 [Cupriavidus sp. U2]
MDWLSPDLIKAALGAIATAAGIWGGIRADLARLTARVGAAHDLARAAHDRLDRHLEGHGE